MTDGPAILLTTAEGLIEGGLFDVLGRMAIGGPAEQEDVGVETFDGDAAEAGLETELGESWLTEVVMDSAPNGAASDFWAFKPGFGATAMAAAMLMTGMAGCDSSQPAADFNVAKVFRARQKAPSEAGIGGKSIPVNTMRLAKIGDGQLSDIAGRMLRVFGMVAVGKLVPCCEHKKPRTGTSGGGGNGLGAPR
jgi:hypothetical protein